MWGGVVLSGLRGGAVILHVVVAILVQKLSGRRILFEELFPLPLFWTDTFKLGFPIAPVVMILLNGWWVTREIEASAARASHIEVDYTRHTVTWLLLASKRDPYAAGEARTHGCGCRNGVRHPACLYHIFLEYYEVLKQRFGHDFASPDRALPVRQWLHFAQA